MHDHHKKICVCVTKKPSVEIMDLRIVEHYTKKTGDMKNELPLAAAHLNGELKPTAAGLNNEVPFTATHELIFTKEHLNELAAIEKQQLNEEASSAAANNQSVMSRSRVIKNFIVLNLGFLFVYTSQMGLSFLQSTLNSEGNVGVISQSLIYVAQLGTSLYLPKIISTRLGLKTAIVIAFVFVIPYHAANLYPMTWIIFPLAVIAGLGLSVIWVCVSAYINELSFLHAEEEAGRAMKITTVFFGIFNMVFSSCQIGGNLISFLVLQPPKNMNCTTITSLNERNCLLYSTIQEPSLLRNRTEVYPSIDFVVFSNKTKIVHSTVEKYPFLSNSTLYLHSVFTNISISCGANYCGGIEHKMEMPSQETRYLLIGIYLFLGILSVLFTYIFLDKLEVKNKSINNDESTRSQMTSAFKQAIKTDQILLIAISIYEDMQLGFMFSDFSESFVACEWGIKYIGLVMIWFASISAIVSGLQSCLVSCIPRPIFITFATVNNISLSIAMLIWETRNAHPSIVFIIAGFWAVGDAIWSTQVTALYGVLFREEEEAAFAIFRFWEAVGMTLSFACNSLLCTSTKLYMHIAVVSIGFVGYFTVELRCYWRQKSFEVIKPQK